MRENLLERKSEAIIIRKIVAIIALITVILMTVTILGGIIYIKSALKPVDPENNKTVKIEVPIGSSTSTIGQTLKEKGIIKNATVFKYYVKLNNVAGFQAGVYDMAPSMTLSEIAQTLQTGTLAREAIFKIAVPEGYQLEQIAESIEKHTDYTKKEIMEKLDDQETIKQLQEKYPDLLTDSLLNKNIKHPLEGYLFPATYSYYEENPPLESIIDPMIQKTYEVVTKYDEQMKEKKMDVHKLLTLASLIEKEATEKADRHLISSVFYNRIQKDMPLQTDPTVLYALGEHKERTMYKDLEVDSPYNTYKVKGLPPGPIANAGEASIKAALNPAESQYLYFLAEYGTGEVHYSKTLEEHNKLKAKYITEKRN
ncbi:endolytic transglycosylase MltG [Siminovitchia sp. FSL H7-0308]|uniref:endolytic transglycosylase MltG n=1 Tax=Siminovitchia sp. FSL H7-0308 TaxID=2921432 RepID=UPI0030EEEA43